ncbi:hypothetical protein ACFQ9X_25350 [Catenulispora yoronensis]
MDISELTPEILAELRTPRPYPAVTLVLPPIRRSPSARRPASRCAACAPRRSGGWPRTRTSSGTCG